MNVGTGRVLWRVALDGSAAGTSSPAVAGGLVYVTTDASQQYVTSATLWALDAATGDVRWSVTGLGDYGVSSAVYSDGMVFVSADGFPATASNLVLMRAFDAATGALLWQNTAFSNESPTGTPAVAGGRVIVAAGATSAFDEATGHVLWVSNATAIGEAYKPVVSVSSGRVFVATRGGIYAIDAATGATLWHFGTTLGVGSRAPAVRGTTIYAQLTSGTTTRIVALRASDGSKIWSRVVFTSSHFYDRNGAAPAIANGLVFVGAPTSQSYGLYVYSAASGIRLRLNGLGSGAGRIFGGPVVSNGRVFVGTEGTGVYAFNLAPLTS